MFQQFKKKRGNSLFLELLHEDMLKPEDLLKEQNNVDALTH